MGKRNERQTVEQFLDELQFLEDESTRIWNLRGITFNDKKGMLREREVDIAFTELESEIGKSGHT